LIITRTPTRVSLCGGGTDFPEALKASYGAVVGGAVSLFSYVSVRELRPFHDFKSRFAYSIVEHVQKNADVTQRVIRGVLRYLGMDRPDSVGLDISHQADLPAGSGLGTSSAFAVGLLNALTALRGERLTPPELADAAIAVERDILGETVGNQDQTYAAHGDLCSIKFYPDGSRSVAPLGLSDAHRTELEQHLLLLYTGRQRISSEIAKTYVFDAKKHWAMLKLVDDAVEALRARNWERLGTTIDQSWRIKGSLSGSVSDANLSRLYNLARIGGAWGGKLTGAGGGGSLLLVVPPDKREKVRAALAAQGCIELPFKFEYSGSQVVYADRRTS
jgi:D-glycero-alpha-D-manno-heptose-7-phosphate kinase